MSIHCCQCGSDRVWKDGLRGNIQRYLCRNCGHRFSESIVKSDVIGKRKSRLFNSGTKLFKDGVVSGQFSAKEFFHGLPFTLGEDVVSHRLTTVGKHLNAFAYNDCKHEGAACMQTTQQTQTVSDVAPSEANTKGKLLEYAWQLTKEGKKDITINRWTTMLKTLLYRGADLNDAESVKQTLALQRWKDSTKNMALKHTKLGFESSKFHARTCQNTEDN